MKLRDNTDCPYLHDIFDQYCNLFKGYKNCDKCDCEVLKILKENEQLEIDNYNHNANLQRLSDMLDEAKKIIKDLLRSERHRCTGEEFSEIRDKAEIFIRDEE